MHKAFKKKSRLCIQRNNIGLERLKKSYITKILEYNMGLKLKFKFVYLICSCNMGMRDLPDMYAQSPRAIGPRDEGIHIRQITSTHVTSNMYHFCSTGVHYQIVLLKLKTTIK